MGRLRPRWAVRVVGVRIWLRLGGSDVGALDGALGSAAEVVGALLG